MVWCMPWGPETGALVMDDFLAFSIEFFCRFVDEGEDRFCCKVHASNLTAFDQDVVKISEIRILDSPLDMDQYDIWDH